MVHYRIEYLNCHEKWLINSVSWTKSCPKMTRTNLHVVTRVSHLILSSNHGKLRWSFGRQSGPKFNLVPRVSHLTAPWSSLQGVIWWESLGMRLARVKTRMQQNSSQQSSWQFILISVLVSSTFDKFKLLRLSYLSTSLAKFAGFEISLASPCVCGCCTSLQPWAPGSKHRANYDHTLSENMSPSIIT